MIIPFWQNGRAELEQLYQHLLRRLRDIYGTDLYEYFSLAYNSSAIVFEHKTMPPQERFGFVDSLNCILRSYHESGLEMRVRSFHDSGSNGCSFKVKLKNLHRFKLPAPALVAGTEQRLYAYGHEVAEHLKEILDRPSNRDPLGWKVVPVNDLPGVWLHVWANNPGVNDLSVSFMEGYITTIQDEFQNPKFRVARFVQAEEHVRILFDYIPRGEQP